MQSQFSTRNENIPNITTPKNHKPYSKFTKSFFLDFSLSPKPFRFKAILLKKSSLEKNFKFSPYGWIESLLSKTSILGVVRLTQKEAPFFRLRWSEVAPQKGEDRSINKFLAESSCVFKRIVL